MDSAAERKSPLAKLKRPNGKADVTLVVVMTILVVMGLVMLYSSSYAYCLAYYGDSYKYIRSQAIYAVLGFILTYAVSRISYRFYYKWAWTLFIISYILLAITLLMPARNGARRWIIIGSYTFQPSELVKFTVIILFSRIASEKPQKMKEFKYGFLQPMGILAAIALIMLNQTHLSGTIIILSIGFILMFVGGTKIIDLILTLAAGAAAVIGVVLTSDKLSYAGSRIEAWLHPFESGGYQTVQSLLAIGSGGLFGLGLGNSRQKQLYLPEPQNDFIFSIVCEELGFIGAFLIILLFVLYVYRGFAIGFKAKDKFSAMTAIGISCQVGIQVVLNIAVVTNTIPNTGISLPFFSQGGTSLMILMAETGVLLSISRYSSSTNIRRR
ncbi:MAG: FtsW/RodA/SpoVE family cell cycle protein [Oscillospiraceae bacterium]|jgi:cell division protein FtsW